MTRRNAARQPAQRPAYECGECGAPARVNPRTGGYRHARWQDDFLHGWKRGRRVTRGLR